jgi:uncharacterized membrane protein
MNSSNALVPGVARMRRLQLVAALLMAAACRPSDDSRSTATSARDSTPLARATRAGLLRGHSFVPCAGADTLQLGELPTALANLRAPGDTGAWFVVLDVSARPDQRATVDRVHYASNERFECFADWSGFDYRATGQNPGWVAEVAGERLNLRREGGATSNWSGLQKDSTIDRVSFTAASAGGTVQLTLHSRPCRNPVSRAYSAWTAALVSGPDRLSGCAVPGLPAQ